MKHLFLAESDYAASGAAFMHALRRVGEECRYHAERQHIYQYPHQPKASPLTPSGAKAAVSWADAVWVIQSDLPVVMGGTYVAHEIGTVLGRDVWMDRLKGKRVVLLHGGGHYRNNRDFYRRLWKKFEPLSLCYEADLMGSFDNEHLVVPPIDPAWCPVVPRDWKGLRIGHFPSRPTDKGSEWIVPLLRGRRGIEFRTSVIDASSETGVDRKPWPEQLLRIAQCDVVVDQVKAKLDGKEFGEWVSIGLESAMCGRISVANSRRPEEYRRTYKRDPGIHVTNTVQELTQEIDRLSGLTDKEIIEEQKESYAWASSTHSLEATGELLLALLNDRECVNPWLAERIDAVTTHA